MILQAHDTATQLSSTVAAMRRMCLSTLLTLIPFLHIWYFNLCR